MTDRINQEAAALESLLPHRAPMLLLDRVLEVSEKHASARVTIDEDNLFFIPGAGVPAWTGLEMMGQTAALMAGFQQQQGLVEAQTGFLLASRHYQSSKPWFVAGQQLRVDCDEEAVVGDNLATFGCALSVFTGQQKSEVFATAQLSVFRQPATPASGDSVA